MGVAEIIGFAACWLIVATLMLWGVFTEHKRGGPPVPAANEWHPSRLARVAPADWIVLETADGGTPEVADHVRFLAGAWLASRGIDADGLAPGELRTEVISNDEGVSCTRALVRAGVLNGIRRRP